MAISFDGPNLLITLESGVTELDVAEIYSSWKEWVQSSWTNSKYLAAFRTVGGDPLSSIINAGAYYFLRNDYGWRIKPPEEDITIYLTGNLAVEDTALGAFNPTDGGFTAAILGLQPVTQGVTPVMAEQLEYASFSGGVWVDQAFGVAGTDGTKGNALLPVNNFTDAVAISQARGLPNTIFIIGDATLDAGDDVANFLLIGQNAARTNITINAAAETTGAEIREAYVTGNLDGGSILRNCVIANLNYVNGYVYNCMLNPGTISLGGASVAHFMDTKSGVPGEMTPVIDLNGAGLENTPLAFRGHTGGIKFIQKNGDADVSCDLARGQLIIELATCTAGKIVARGIGKVVDEFGNHLHSGTYGGLTLLNEVVSGQHLHDAWQRLGLDPNNPVTNKPDGGFTTGDIVVIGSGSGADIIQTRQ